MGYFMSMKVVIDDAVVQVGTTKEGKQYFFVEVLEPVRKFIAPAETKDLAVISDLADKKQKLSELVLHQRGNQLIFATELQTSI